MTHIATHHDRIWLAGCQQKEDQIIQQLEQLPDVELGLVDAYMGSTNRRLITDNHFYNGQPHESVAPEFWHIYRCDTLAGGNIEYPFNCMMNRISGERLVLLYELERQGALEKGLVSFNCLYHDFNPDITQRKQNFNQCREDCDIGDDHLLHLRLWSEVPIMIDHDPDTAALASTKTLVVESYVSNDVVAFSEKIFRALQTARPWTLLCSPGSVSILRESGFDVMDDVVDHAYDLVQDQTKRTQMIVEETMRDIDYDENRWLRAARHNQSRLDDLALRWPQRLEYLLQSIKV